MYQCINFTVLLYNCIIKIMNGILVIILPDELAVSKL